MNEELLLEGAERQEVSKFKDSIKRYTKKWPFLLISVVACVFISIFYLQYKPNQYRVESKVLIKKSQQFSDPNELLFGGRSAFRRLGKINDEAVVFKSFPLIRSTLTELEFDVTYKKKGRFKDIELYKKSPFLVLFNREQQGALPLNTVLQIQSVNENEFLLITSYPFEGESIEGVYQYDQSIKLGSFSFKIKDNKKEGVRLNPDETYFISFNSIDKISYSYRNKLKFDEVEGMSSILTMSMNTFIPEKSIDFINTLVNKYIENSLYEKNEVSKNIVDFIDNQLSVISDSLSNKEQNLENFKSSEDIADLSIEGSMMIEQYNQIESEKAQFEVRQQYYDFIQKNLKGTEATNVQNLIAPSAFGIEDPIVNELVKSLLDMSLTMQTLEKEGNTKGQLSSQLASRIEQVTQALNESIENLSNANKILLNKLNNRSDRLIVNAKKLPSTERQLINLNRLLKLNENIYLFLMEKRSSAAITMSSNTSDCKVVEPAMLNPLQPTAPNRKMIYMIAVMVGIFFPILIMTANDFLNDTIRGKEEIESGSQVPIIGSVPKTVIKGSSMVVSERPKSAVAESFRIIRSNLSFFQGKKSPFVILVTSSIAKEGKTYCALNLSSILASSGKKTIILGFDLRKPQLHNYVGIENGKGISNYIAGSVDLGEIILPTEQKNLFMINSGAIPPNPAELLMEDRMKQLIQELKERFDYIIMDTPPIGIVTDALILKDQADMNLFVIRQDYSKREFLDNLNDLYTGKRLKNLSVLLNDVQANNNYGYGYYENDNVKSGFFSFLRKG